jgi:hypothetical protein
MPSGDDHGYFASRFNLAVSSHFVAFSMRNTATCFCCTIVSVLQVPVWCSLRRGQQWGVDLYVFDDCE